MSERYPRDTCYICDFDTTGLLEKHHIVPQRYGGGEEGNVVHLCPRCHEAVEKLYNKAFYNVLGAESGSSESVGIRVAKAAGEAVGEGKFGPEHPGLRAMDAVLSECEDEAIVCERCRSVVVPHEVSGGRIGCEVCSRLQEPEPWQMLGVAGNE